MLLVFSDFTPVVVFVASLQKGIKLLESYGTHSNYFSPLQGPTKSIQIDLMYSKDEILFQNHSDKNIYKYVYIFNY